MSAPSAGGLNLRNSVQFVEAGSIFPEIRSPAAQICSRCAVTRPTRSRTTTTSRTGLRDRAPLDARCSSSSSFSTVSLRAARLLPAARSAGSSQHLPTHFTDGAGWLRVGAVHGRLLDLHLLMPRPRLHERSPALLPFVIRSRFLFDVCGASYQL